jgi:hypothetical protein
MRQIKVLLNNATCNWTISEPKDFAELIELSLGHEAKKYFEEWINLVETIADSSDYISEEEFNRFLGRNI